MPTSSYYPKTLDTYENRRGTPITWFSYFSIFRTANKGRASHPLCIFNVKNIWKIAEIPDNLWAICTWKFLRNLTIFIHLKLKKKNHFLSKCEITKIPIYHTSFVKEHFLFCFSFLENLEQWRFFFSWTYQWIIFSHFTFNIRKKFNTIRESKISHFHSSIPMKIVLWKYMYFNWKKKLSNPNPFWYCTQNSLF